MEHPSFDRTLTKEDDFLGLKFNDVTKNYLYVWSYSVCTYSGRSTAFFSRESYSQPEYRKKGLLVTIKTEPRQGTSSGSNRTFSRVVVRQTYIYSKNRLLDSILRLYKLPSAILGTIRFALTTWTLFTWALNNWATFIGSDVKKPTSSRGWTRKSLFFKEGKIPSLN